MPSKEELLESISPDMKLTKSFFKKIYGYELTWPGFAETALLELEISAGCCKAWDYYTEFSAEWQQDYNNMMKKAAEWYRKQEFRKVVRMNNGERRNAKYQFAGFPKDW